MPAILLSEPAPQAVLLAQSADALSESLTLAALAALARCCHGMCDALRPAIERTRKGMRATIAVARRVGNERWGRPAGTREDAARGVVSQEFETSRPGEGWSRVVERWVLDDPDGGHRRWDVFHETSDVFCDLFGVRRGRETFRCRLHAPNEPPPAAVGDGWRESFARSAVPPAAAPAWTLAHADANERKEEEAPGEPVGGPRRLLFTVSSRKEVGPSIDLITVTSSVAVI